jgi:hypothetical protein
LLQLVDEFIPPLHQGLVDVSISAIAAIAEADHLTPNHFSVTAILVARAMRVECQGDPDSDGVKATAKPKSQKSRLAVARDGECDTLVARDDFGGISGFEVGLGKENKSWKAPLH